MTSIYERTARVALLTGLCVILSSCFILPGKFNSELTLLGDDRFAFTYEGEIHLLGASDAPGMMGSDGSATSDEFEPELCYTEETSQERECTAAELAQQKAALAQRAAQRGSEREAQQMAEMMGGIDASDPEAQQEFVEVLIRQKGWQKVVPIGDGAFDVTYAIEGELSHDFLFPVIEDLPFTRPFVQIQLRKDDVVKIDAPLFSGQNGMGPLTGMMGGLAGLGQMGEEDGEKDTPETPAIPEVEGTFTIVTIGDIRANNTDEGPTSHARGQMLRWDVSPRTQQPPMALIDMTP